MELKREASLNDASQNSISLNGPTVSSPNLKFQSTVLKKPHFLFFLQSVKRLKTIHRTMLGPFFNTAVAFRLDLPSMFATH